jgi:hypothetical protein
MSNIELRIANVEVGHPSLALQHSTFSVQYSAVSPLRHRRPNPTLVKTRAVSHHVVRVCVFGGGEMSNIELRIANVEVGHPSLALQHATFSVHYSAVSPLRHRRPNPTLVKSRAVPRYRKRPSRPTALQREWPGAPRAPRPLRNHVPERSRAVCRLRSTLGTCLSSEAPSSTCSRAPWRGSRRSPWQWRRLRPVPRRRFPCPVPS